MQVVVDGLLTTYARVGAKGDGKKLLVLHGWADDSRGWTGFVSGLADGFEAVIPDLPGFGGTVPPSGPWGLDEYGRFVGHFLEKIDYRPDVVIAHSNGGAIAVRSLSKGDMTTDRLVLLASAGIRNRLSHGKRAVRAITKIGKVVTYPLPAGVRKGLRSRLYGAIGSDQLVAEHMQATFKRIVTDDIQNDASTLSLPTLLVYGEDDTAAPVQYGRILHNLIAGSRLEILPGTGHFVHLDKPDETGRLVREFIT